MISLGPDIVVPRTRLLTLNSGDADPTDNDITEVGGTPVAGDFDVRDTTERFLEAPMIGWRRFWSTLRVTTGYDQTLTVKVWGAYATGASTLKRALLATFALPTSTVMAVHLGNGPAGLAGQVGADPAVDEAYYDIGAMGSHPPYITISWKAGTNPTAGAIELIVFRST